jgi:hypothetical protein
MSKLTATPGQHRRAFGLPEKAYRQGEEGIGELPDARRGPAISAIRLSFRSASGATSPRTSWTVSTVRPTRSSTTVAPRLLWW